jgi:flagellar protein FliL
MAAEKPEKTEKPAPEAAPAAAPAEAAAPKAGGGIMGFLPLIIALVLAPVISWVVAEFVLLPRMKSQLTAAVAGHETAAGEAGPAKVAEPAAAKEPARAKEPAAEKGKEAHAAKKEAPKKGGKAEAAAGKVSADGPNSYQFDNVVVNLSGTMGTRYLKVTFMLTGKDTLREMFDERKPELLDTTLNTLGSVTLSDLEEVGSRNLIRARLVAAYNDLLGAKIVEQIYFSDFVVQ